MMLLRAFGLVLVGRGLAQQPKIEALGHEVKIAVGSGSNVSILT